MLQNLRPDPINIKVNCDLHTLNFAGKKKKTLHEISIDIDHVHIYSLCMYRIYIYLFSQSIRLPGIYLSRRTRISNLIAIYNINIDLNNEKKIHFFFVPPD